MMAFLFRGYAMQQLLSQFRSTFVTTPALPPARSDGAFSLDQQPPSSTHLHTAATAAGSASTQAPADLPAPVPTQTTAQLLNSLTKDGVRQLKVSAFKQGTPFSDAVFANALLTLKLAERTGELDLTITHPPLRLRATNIACDGKFEISAGSGPWVEFKLEPLMAWAAVVAAHTLLDKDGQDDTFLSRDRKMSHLTPTGKTSTADSRPTLTRAQQNKVAAIATLIRHQRDDLPVYPQFKSTEPRLDQLHHIGSMVATAKRCVDMCFPDKADNDLAREQLGDLLIDSLTKDTTKDLFVKMSAAVVRLGLGLPEFGALFGHDRRIWQKVRALGY